MDFYRIVVEETKTGPKMYPEWIIGRSKDLMIRGGGFYAIWDEQAGFWSTDEYDVQRLVDSDLQKSAAGHFEKKSIEPRVQYLSSFGNAVWSKWKKYIRESEEHFRQLDSKLMFKNGEVKRADYCTRVLPYALERGDVSAWDELVGTLYSPDERAKIEWAIGAIVSGDSKRIQKFLVFYGSAGTGKSTILNIIQDLFQRYTATIDAGALGSGRSDFATAVFKTNPLVAIQHDGDLSKIDDNTRLNSIISHEDILVNEKFKAEYTIRVSAMLMIGTNKPVKISDAKSGLIRRLIDVNPTGVTFKPAHYKKLMSQIEFELGAIAHHCLHTYLQMGKDYYAQYRPVEMMFSTDPFLNFVESNYDEFKKTDGISLKRAYSLYKEYCDNSGMKTYPQYRIREELRNYFAEYHDRIKIDGVEHYSQYVGFTFHKFKEKDETGTSNLVLCDDRSLLDDLLADYPSQLAKEDGTPLHQWRTVTTRLHEIDTTQLHYVMVPPNHIVIDFDLKDDNGDKSLELNLHAASLWPPTYAELSQSGGGVHLHYTYEGDVDELSSKFSEGIEVKVYKGNASLRRKVVRCNSTPVAEIQGGLPLKEKKHVNSVDAMKSERGMRELIHRNLRKEVHPGTKPSVDFIKKILDDAYDQGMVYDVTDLRSKVIVFAANSSNQNLVCLKVVQQMKWKSEHSAEPDVETPPSKDERRVFFDVEVYPNLFGICWKYEGDPNVVKMINPSSQDVELLFRLKLVGFNNRRYDNHILWAAFLGYSNQQLYELSYKMINGTDRFSGTFGEAYGLSYADVYDLSSKKQGLKKFQIDLGLRHVEMALPWDEPVPEDRIEEVMDYCANDVISLEAVAQDRAQDFAAREILAELSGLSVNDTTAKHTSRILFGSDRQPQKQFIYTDLAKTFPGYEFNLGKSLYRDEDPGEGGYVYAEPGMYNNVALLDVASMHPTSMEIMQVFGDEYTANYAALKAARIAIKRKQYDVAGKMFEGRLTPYLVNPDDAEALSYALKIVINIVYGLTSAKFDNPFRDVRNVDNIVAKRGALFMIDLKHFVQEKGFTVAHIKTDSIKIPDATPEIIESVFAFGRQYGYEFEHEATYEKFCLVNDAVYVAYTGGKWSATGTQFAHPVVFKRLFTGDEPVWDDLCETKSVVQGEMYLDFDIDSTIPPTERELQFVGRNGRFIPVSDAENGGKLWRIKDNKHYAVSGTKGFLWLEATVAHERAVPPEIDRSYHEKLVSDAIAALGKFGDVEEFLS